MSARLRTMAALLAIILGALVGFAPAVSAQDWQDHTIPPLYERLVDTDGDARPDTLELRQTTATEPVVFCDKFFQGRPATSAQDFRDKMWKCFWSIEGEVFLTYELFDRPPDPGGALHWRNLRRTGYSLEWLGEQFAASEEMRLRHGHMSVDEFILYLYPSVLGRNAEAEGFNFWKQKIQKEGWSRGKVTMAFVLSEEHHLQNFQKFISWHEYWVYRWAMHPYELVGRTNL